MTHEQLIEIVARAMQSSIGGSIKWENHPTQIYWMELAQAALTAAYEAMKEPTPEMVKVSTVVIDSLHPDASITIDIRFTWKAVLAASPLNGGVMKREYWSPEYLEKASRLLSDAARQVNTSWPHSVTRPCPETLEAAKSMIDAALKCIKRAQPGGRDDQ